MATPEEIRLAISHFLHVAPDKLGDEVELRSVVAESFVLVELVMELQEQFGVRMTGEDLRDVRQVGQLLALIEERS